MAISLFIDGKQVEKTTFKIPEMNLSSSRSSMVAHQFEFRFSSTEIITLLSKEYDQHVLESKEDDEQMGSPQDDLAIAEYPDLEEILKDQHLAHLVIGNYLIRELLEKCTWDGKTRN